MMAGKVATTGLPSTLSQPRYPQIIFVDTPPPPWRME
jgi:hypothetical protein